MTTEAPRSHVLLVEDSDSDAAWLQEVLATSPVGQVVRTRTVHDALEVLAAGGIELVLLDLGLPDADGMEGLTAVRDRFDGPVVVLTGHDEQDFGPASVRHGAQEFLAKDDLDAATLPMVMRYARERHAQSLAVGRARQRLQRYARAVAHDLRSPLATVQGFADLIVEDQQATAPDGSPSLLYAERIVATVARLSAMLDQLLVDAETTGEDEDVDLGLAAHAAIDLLGEEVDGRGATVVVGDLPTVRGRRAGLRQVLLNLIGNSLRHATVERPHVEVRAEHGADGAIDVIVADDGETVDPELIAAGQPLEAARLKPRGDGHGFGLRSVAMVVDEHDGQTWLQTSASGGLQVRLTFPSDRVVVTDHDAAPR